MQRDEALLMVKTPDLVKHIYLFNQQYFLRVLDRHQLNLRSLYYKNPQNSYFRHLNVPAFEFLQEEERLCLLDDAALKVIIEYLGACLLAPYLQNALFVKDKELILQSLERKIYDFTLNFSCYYFTQEFYSNFTGLNLAQALNSLPKYGAAALMTVASVFAHEELKEYLNTRINTFWGLEDLMPNVKYAHKIFVLIKRVLEDQDSKWRSYFL